MRVVALDVGGTSMKGGVVTADGLGCRARVGTPRPDGPDAVVDAIVRTVADQVAAADGQQVDAVGLAIPGIVDEAEGIARHSANVGWNDVPLRMMVSARTELPVVMCHDVRAAAVAEAVMGAGRGHREVVFLSLGTGLAAAHVVDGKVRPGASWQAGEIGQVPVTDRSGNMTALERVAAAWALGHRYEEDCGLAAGASDAAAVIEAAASGDRVAERVFDEALGRLAEALAVVISFADPAVVIIGGGLSLAGDALIKPLAAQVAAALCWRESPPLVMARFGDEAGWAGAALLAWRHAGHPEGSFPWGAWL